MDNRHRVRLERKEDFLKEKIISLAAEVQKSVGLSMKAIRDRAPELAQNVIEHDKEIDIEEVEVKENCLEVFALHQPVAMDLRFVVGVFQITNQLERIGDLAVNIARVALFLCSEPPLEIPADYFYMAEKTQNMLKKSIDTFLKMDDTLAAEVLADDDEVDKLKHKLHRNLEERLVEELNRRKALIHLFLVSRHLERISDHCANIAEDIIYMVTGEIVRHGHTTVP